MKGGVDRMLRNQNFYVYAQLSMRESRISPMTADELWPWSSEKGSLVLV